MVNLTSLGRRQFRRLAASGRSISPRNRGQKGWQLSRLGSGTFQVEGPSIAIGREDRAQPFAPIRSFRTKRSSPGSWFAAGSAAFNSRFGGEHCSSFELRPNSRVGGQSCVSLLRRFARLGSGLAGGSLGRPVDTCLRKLAYGRSFRAVGQEFLIHELPMAGYYLQPWGAAKDPLTNSGRQNLIKLRLQKINPK